MKPLRPARTLLLTVVATLLAATSASAQQQIGDPDFRPVVARPAYVGGGPAVLLDEAHGSVQTIVGRYAGFAALVRADGYDIRAGVAKLDAPGALDGVAVLVISNPAAPSDGSSPSAFTETEIAAVDAWVRNGGSLLLAADHAPHGSAAEALGRMLGVGMGKGYAFRFVDGDITSQLMHVRAAGALGDHPILRGRDPEEAVEAVKAFTGQSLTGPEGSIVLLALQPGDREARDSEVLGEIRTRIQADPASRDVVLADLSAPALRAQGLAFIHGRGRVVVLGEAGMLTAQLVRFPEGSGRADFRFGLQTEGHDDQQFVLNIMHWLSGLLP
jgi:hypothetical protein